MATKIERFDQLWLDLILKVQPSLVKDVDRFRETNDFFRIFFDGLVLNANLWTRESRAAAMRKLFPKLLETIQGW